MDFGAGIDSTTEEGLLPLFGEPCPAQPDFLATSPGISGPDPSPTLERPYASIIGAPLPDYDLKTAATHATRSQGNGSTQGPSQDRSHQPLKKSPPLKEGSLKELGVPNRVVAQAYLQKECIRRRLSRGQKERSSQKASTGITSL